MVVSSPNSSTRAFLCCVFSSVPSFSSDLVYFPILSLFSLFLFSSFSISNIPRTISHHYVRECCSYNIHWIRTDYSFGYRINMVVMVKPQQQGGVQQAFGWYTGRCRFEQNGSQRAHPKTRSQATRDRRYRSESGGRAGTQQFIGTMSLVHRRSLSLDLSTLAKLYSHMEDDGASEPAKTPTSAGAGQRLGPKVNTDAINAGLRALDRPGAPCRRWEREILQLKSFTGVLGQLPSWRSPKPPRLTILARL